MTRLSLASLGSGLGRLLGFALLSLLAVPLIALVTSASPHDLHAALSHPLFTPALWLSVRTTLLSLAITIALGTPLAWWLSRSTSRAASVASILVELPIVLPPAVVGVMLLQTFGRQGLFGSTLAAVSLHIPFTSAAVVLAQIVVSAPFFVRAAVNAFAKVDPDTMIVARTLGASPASAFFRVAVPIALPGLAVGASLACARSLGEFGATLIFAGNMSGTTQTMPLAIFTALESDLNLAVAFSLVLAAVGLALLLGVQLVAAVSTKRVP